MLFRRWKFFWVPIGGEFTIDNGFSSVPSISFVRFTRSRFTLPYRLVILRQQFADFTFLIGESILSKKRLGPLLVPTESSPQIGTTTTNQQRSQERGPHLRIVGAMHQPGNPRMCDLTRAHTRQSPNQRATQRAHTPAQLRRLPDLPQRVRVLFEPLRERLLLFRGH